MGAVAVNLVLVAGLVAGACCGVWLNRRTDLSFVRERGFSRYMVWLLRGMLFLGAMSLVTVPFQVLALAIA